MSGALNGLAVQNNGAGQFANGALLHATMPSTLVKAVSLTNDGEAAQLAEKTRQDDIAAVITKGIQSWNAPR